MSATATILPARIDHDAAAWVAALRQLGWSIRSAEPSDVDWSAGDLVLVHDLAAFPPDDANTLLAALRASHPSVLFRHRDLPWQRRDRDAYDIAALRSVPRAIHVTPSLGSRHELEARGFVGVHCLPDAFDLDPAPGARDAVRTELGFGHDEIVVLQPTRAEARKNVAGAVRFVNELAKIIRNRPLRLWIRGPVADDHRTLFERLSARCAVPVTVAEVERPADAYAACDVVVFPAAWDCSGDVVLEAIAHRRPCVATDFPVLGELVASGIRVLPIDDPGPTVRFLAQPEPARLRSLDATARRARVSYSLADLPDRVHKILAGAT